MFALGDFESETENESYLSPSHGATTTKANVDFKSEQCGIDVEKLKSTLCVSISSHLGMNIVVQIIYCFCLS